MVVFLSYPVDPRDLVWPGEPTVEIHQATSIGVDGSACNTFCNIIPDHVGTHYDAPWHFNPNGVKIAELPVEYFWFEKPLVLDIEKKPDEGIMVEDLKPYENEIKKADILLIKTGGSKMRKEQPEMYQKHGQYIHPDTAKYMVETFPNLRTVGFDFLSIGCPSNDLSAAAHQILLGCHNGKFITGIEDMNLTPLYETDKKVIRVVVGPLRVVDTDSGQVTVFAELED